MCCFHLTVPTHGSAQRRAYGTLPAAQRAVSSEKHLHCPSRTFAWYTLAMLGWPVTVCPECSAKNAGVATPAPSSRKCTATVAPCQRAWKMAPAAPAKREHEAMINGAEPEHMLGAPIFGPEARPACPFLG